MQKSIDGITVIKKPHMKVSLSRLSEDVPIRMPALGGRVKKAVSSDATKKVVTLGVLFSMFLLWSVALRPSLAISETDLIAWNEESSVLKDPSYDEEVLWFSRIIYSETKDVEEQVLVAWVVRNRVETGFRGNTYKEVALSASQFSGLNSFDRNYYRNINLDYADNVPGWRTAVEVAKLVYDAPEAWRPFSIDTRHFYSPMVVSPPSWTHGRTPVREIKNAWGGVRFAFYQGVE